MMDAKLYSISVAMNDEEAWALALLLKRMRHDVYRSLSEDEEEAFTMQEAAYKLKKALDQAGFCPR